MQLESSSSYPKALDGIRINAEASLHTRAGICKERGEVLFTSYGLSGPAIMQLSGQCVRALYSGENPIISLDIFPGLSADELSWLLEERRAGRPWVPLEDHLAGLLPKKLGMMALKASGIGPMSKTAGDLSGAEHEALIKTLVSWEFPITGDRGLNNAQVTIGGAVTSEFCPETLESRILPGLFACGEVLDIDGDCGGYNLQWAWSSGRLAGLSSAAYAKQEKR